MVAFHNSLFPISISQGATGGPGFHTTILMLASGFEQRNIDWAKSRATYDVSHAVKDDTLMAALINFFMARNGRAHAFPFQDPLDYRAPFWSDVPGDIDPLQVLFTTDGAMPTFQLIKAYGDGVATYTRKITRPKAGSLLLYNGSTPYTPVTDYTYDTTTGIVTLSGAVAATTGVAITGSFEFYVPVRFDTDDLAGEATDAGISAWRDIKLIEVRE